MWPRQENLQAIWEEWNEFRAEARRTAFSPKEFGEMERTKYDLDDAGITGADNRRTYSVNRVNTEVDGTQNNGTDIRTLENR